MEMQRTYKRSDAIGLEELQVAIAGALAEELADEPPLVRDNVKVEVDEHSEGLGAVTTVVALWMLDKAAGKLVDRTLDSLWDRIIDRVRARKGSDVLQPADDDAESSGASSG
jgi:hypothetical protein